MKKLKLTREFKIGFFCIAMLGLLYWGVNFLKGTDVFTSTSNYYAVYDQVNGLQPSANIVIKGFKVGTISEMSYNPQNSESVVVEFAIKSKYKIPKNSKARIFSDGLMSGKSVEIILGDSQQFMQEGDTLYSEINKDFLEVAGSEVEFMKQRVNEVIAEVMVTLQNVNTIMTDNSKNLATTMQNAASISGNIDQLLSQEKGSIREMINNLNSLSHTLQSKEGQIGRIINNAEAFSDSLSKAQFPSMIAEMTTTLNKLNTTLEKVNNGEGTVGKFVNDEQLYDSLVTASSNLSLLLEDLKVNPKRYINISVFGGGNKEKKKK